MRVGALGRTKILYDSIVALHEAGQTIAFVLTSGEAPEYSVTADDFRKLARRLKVPFMKTEKINAPETLAWIRRHETDVGVSVNWKTLIRPETLNAFRLGIINAHAGDLPRFRGNAAPNWAILSGEPRVVFTLHLMGQELDAGPILLKKDMPIGAETYIFHVYDRMESILPQMFVDAVYGLERGTIRPQPQPSTGSLRCYPRIPTDGEIDWKKPAVHLHRLVRASAEPFSGAYTFLGGRKLTVWRARREPAPTPFLGVAGHVAEIRAGRGEVVVLCGEGLLVLEDIQLEGGKRQRAAEVIKSLRTRLGLDYAMEILQLQKLRRR